MTKREHEENMSKKIVAKICIVLGLVLVFWAGFYCVTEWQADVQSGVKSEQLLLEVQALLEEQKQAESTAEIEQVSTEEDLRDGESALQDAQNTQSTQDMQEVQNDTTSVSSLNGAFQAEDVEGILELPTVGITLPILKEFNMENLKTAPCVYKGEDGSIERLVISGHSYKYHFRPLRQMSVGDELRFTWMDGYSAEYEVTEIYTIAPEDVDMLTTGEWDLSLFSCTSGGEMRILVRCKEK